MSMSTRIEDLPGPIPDDVRQDLEEFQNDDQLSHQEQNQTNIKANIRKKVRFADDEEENDWWSFLSKEVTEENMLLLVILLLASMPHVYTPYVAQIPFIGEYIRNENFMGYVTKASVLLFLYIAAKNLILPRLKI